MRVTVWVLEIDDKSGRVISVHGTEDEAIQCLIDNYDYANESKGDLEWFLPVVTFTLEAHEINACEVPR